MTADIRQWQPADEARCNAAFRASYLPVIEECAEDYRQVAHGIVSRSADSAFKNMPDYFRNQELPSAWVAETGSELVGYVDTWFTTPDTAYIGNIFVIPDVRRRGLANRLMDVAENYAIGNGAKKITLRSAHVLLEAHALYLRRGYQLTGTGPTEARREITFLYFAKDVGS